MNANDVKLYAALSIAGIALAVSIHANLRADRAEERLQQLERTAASDAARPAQAPTEQPPTAQPPIPSMPPTAVAPPVMAQPKGDPVPAPNTDSGPRFYSTIEPSNPAVLVRQKPDGTFDISTRDPSLAGAIITAKARTAAGVEDHLLIRVP